MSPKLIYFMQSGDGNLLSRSRSARGSCATGPSPRHTFAVGPSSRIWLNAHRVPGNLPLDPSLKRTVLSAGGGKPCITLLATGSVCAALGSFGTSSALTSGRGCLREREQASEHESATGAEAGHGVSAYRFCAVAAMAVR